MDLAEIGLHLLCHPQSSLQKNGRTLLEGADAYHHAHFLTKVIAKAPDMAVASRLLDAVTHEAWDDRMELLVTMATRETLAPLLARHNHVLHSAEYARFEEDDDTRWIQGTGWFLKHAHPAAFRHYLGQARRPLAQPLLAGGTHTGMMEMYNNDPDAEDQPGLLQAGLLWLANPPPGCNPRWMGENILLLLEHEGRAEIPAESTEKRSIAELLALPGIPEDIRQAVGIHLDKNKKLDQLAARMAQVAGDWMNDLPPETRVRLPELEESLGLPVPWLDPVVVDGEKRTLFDWLLSQRQREITPELRHIFNREPEPLRGELATRFFCQYTRNADVLAELVFDFGVPGSTETLTHLMNYMTDRRGTEAEKVRKILNHWQPDWHGKDEAACEQVLRHAPAPSLGFLLETGFDPNLEFGDQTLLSQGKNGFEVLLGEISRWNSVHLHSGEAFLDKWATLWPLRNETSVLRLPECLEEVLALPMLEHEYPMREMLTETLATLSQQRLASTTPAPNEETSPSVRRRL